MIRGSVLGVCVLLAACSSTSSLGDRIRRSPPPPLVVLGRASIRLPVSGTGPITFGLVLIDNQGRRVAHITGLRLLGAHGASIVGSRLQLLPPRRDTPTALDHWPPREYATTAGTGPIPPSVRNDTDTGYLSSAQLLIGIAFDRRASFDGVQVDYRVDGDRYRLQTQMAGVFCRTAHVLDGCP